MIIHKIYTTTSELPEEWDNLSHSDIFLQSKYLEVLEKSCPKTIKCFFVGVFKNDQLVGIGLLQQVQLYAKDMFRRNGSSVLKKTFRAMVAPLLKGHILVFGNLTHTGQHGYVFKPGEILPRDFFKAISKASFDLKRMLREEKGKKIRLFLLKDFFEEDAVHQFSEDLLKMGFIKAKAQPNMILPIEKAWQMPEDYVNVQVKKYRRRYKTARKKLNAEKRELGLQEIITHSETLYELYKNVSDNAKFNTFILPKRHFCSFKEFLGDKFKLIGYFHEGNLVGFYTLIENKGVLETYFLGYDEAHQYENQLYLNMLYDMAEYAISNGFNSVVYARTAMEIKSSVGARPYDMDMYLMHTNGILNAIIRQVYNLMNPKRDWEERNPFGN